MDDSSILFDVFNYDDEAVISLLKEHPEYVRNCTEDGFTPLHSAVESGAISTIIFILGLVDDMDINAKTQDGATALHNAVMCDSFIVELLVKYGADPNIKDNYGRLPINIAASSLLDDSLKSLEFLWGITNRDLLLEKQDIKRFRTILHECLYLGIPDYLSFGKLRFLLENGADVLINVQDKYGRTPLHLASMKGDYRCVQILLENEANQNIIDDNGHTIIDNPNMEKLVKSFNEMRDTYFTKNI